MRRSITLPNIISFVFILLGVSVIVLGFQFFHPLQDVTTYDVEKLDEEPSSAEVHRFENLSERGRKVFLRALEAPDNGVEVTEFPWENKTPTDIKSRSEGWATPVRYRGQAYVVWAHNRGHYFATIIFCVLFVIGTGLIVAGRRLSRIPDQREDF